MKATVRKLEGRIKELETQLALKQKELEAAKRAEKRVLSKGHGEAPGGSVLQSQSGPVDLPFF